MFNITNDFPELTITVIPYAKTKGYPYLIKLLKKGTVIKKGKLIVTNNSLNQFKIIYKNETVISGKGKVIGEIDFVQIKNNKNTITRTRRNQ